MSETNGTPFSMCFEDAEPQVIEVTIKGKAYRLKEPTADVAAKYRSASARCARFSEGKMQSIDGVGDIEPYLVSMCLFEVLPGGNLKQVPIPTVRSWKASIIRPLFDKAKEMGLLEEEKDTPKSLKKKITELQTRLRSLQGNKSGETDADLDPVGNLSTAMEDISS